MKSTDFLKLTTREMEIEILSSDAWRFSCEAQNEFTLNGNSDKYNRLIASSKTCLNKANMLR